jgi:hypothetical protein
MPAFSIPDAAFEGFRLTRERPGVVGAWALLYGLASLVTGVVMILTVGPKFAMLQAAARSRTPPDTAAAMQQIEALAPFFLAVLPLVLLFWSVLTCAVYRAILRPHDGGFGRIRLGADEVRMMGLTVVLWLLMMPTLFFWGLFLGIGGVLASAGGPLAALLQILVQLAAFGLIAWVWIHLSLAGPLTFVSGEIHIFRSWALARGHFWRLAAAYALALVLAAVIELLAQVIFKATAAVYVTAVGRPLADISKVFEPNMSSLAAYFTPAQVLSEAFWAVLQVVIYAVLISPAVVIHGALTGRPVNT